MSRSRVAEALKLELGGLVGVISSPGLALKLLLQNDPYKVPAARDLRTPHTILWRLSYISK